MEEFCGEPFWNATLLLDNGWPQLSTCFLDLVVKCGPCVMFWLAIPCHVYMTEANHIRTHGYQLPASRLSVAKLVCGCTLCVLTVLEFLFRVSRGTSQASWVGHVALLVTLMAATSMSRYEKSRNLVTSAPLFIFWTLKAFCDVIPFYTEVMLENYNDNFEDFVVFLVGYIFTVTLMVLYAFADPVAVFFVTKSCSKGEKICPEATASFLNKLAFAWLNKLMVAGYRRGIEMGDLWTLSPRDQSATVLPAFHRLWEQEVQRCQRWKEKQQRSATTVSSLIPRGSGGRQGRRCEGTDPPSETTPLMNGSATLYSSQSPWTQRNRPSRMSDLYQDNVELSEHKQESFPASAGGAEQYDYDVGDGEVLSGSRHSAKKTTSMTVEFRRGGGGQGRPSLLRVLFRQFWGTLVVFLIQRVASDTFLISMPLLLGALITHLSERAEGREWQGYVLAVALLLSATLRSVFYAAGCYRSYYLGLQIKSVVVGAVYNKALRINNAAKRKATSGEITSLMSVDAQRLQEFISRIFFGVSVPVVLGAVVVIIYSYVHSAALASFIVLAILVPATGIAGVLQKKVQEKLLEYKDLRVRIFSEILNGIKVLKLYAWEESFQRRVAEARDQEIQCLWRVALLYIVLGICTNLMSFLMNLATYGWYVLSDRANFLDASTAFAIMSLLGMLTPILENMGMTISFFVQAKVSVKRINDFLCSEELDLDSVTRTNEKHDEAIHVKRATFAWDDPSYPNLHDIDLRVGSGRLVAVVGQVGAGKSSLINCILGEMIKLRGHVSVKGSVAYVPQQAWIQNGTVRDNILFGQPYVSDRYNAVVRACQLERDLTILPASDMTEIGEKGTNLSGGQKQRVSLARAVYSDNDILLLDDPLSAVDSHVGKAIFADVIGPRGILRGKTRVLVTHGVHWLPLVDEIVVLKQGRISEVGSYSRLMQHNGNFAQFLKTFFSQENDASDDDLEEEDQPDPEVLAMRQKIWEDVESATTDAGMETTTDAGTSGDELRHILASLIAPRRRRRKERGKRQQRVSKRKKEVDRAQTAADEELEEQGKLVASETLRTGRAPFHVYLHYPRAAGLAPLLGAILLFAGFRATTVEANFWLRRWTEDPLLTNQSLAGTEDFVHANDYYLAIYGVFGIVQVILLLAFNGLFWTTTIRASRRLHERMITSLFRAPMAFFDTTPSGRIMNRISADMEIVDNLMPLIIRDLVSPFTVLVAILLVLVVVSPYSALVLLPLGLLTYFIVAAYVPVSRQCRRMEAVARSPVFAHFSETLSGAAVIRAYRATERFMALSKAKVDRNQVCYFAWLASMRWIQMALDFVTNFVIFMAAILEIVSPDPSGASAGLSVSYALQLSYTIIMVVRMATDFETNMVSVERIKEYSELESEAPWVKPLRPQPSWPPRGTLEFRDYQTRYRPGLDLVLKGVSCHVQGGEKVGIVGRTGAGKSSLSLSLFRLIEAAGGAILIDGLNIADLGLHDLRARLTILPQDPVLFSGSLRFNLDPFGEFEDQALWRALEKAHLKDFVQALPAALHYQCGEEGLNLSVGQRQLVCLARTLLRRTRVLVLDEATAAVDVETDALIQSTVRHAFHDCTVLTIAHRLNTILDYDKILVLDAGKVVEYDSPQRLQAKPDSVFLAMLKDAGLA